jgi:hypothetical protein
VEDGGEQAQVGGDRRVATEQLDHPPLDIQVAAVDLVATGDHRAAQGGVAGHQPTRGPGQGGPDEGALGLHVRLQPLQGVVEAVSIGAVGGIGVSPPRSRPEPDPTSRP